MRMRDIRYGLHSRIPVCCILWFVTLWPLLFKTEAAGTYWRWMEEMRGGGMEYIPCPFCILMGRVKEIKSCTREGCKCSF